MRKEVIGILLFFLVIFSLISLVSYSPNDPSIHHAKAAGSIHNLFGLVGAHLAGILIGLFGLGAFGIPILLLFLSIHFFGDQRGRAPVLTISGGMLLIVSTGSLLSFQHDHYLLFGSEFSSGGIVGIPLKSFLVNYSNATGAAIILFLLWMIGFILATGFSLIAFSRQCWRFGIFSANRISNLYVIWRERRKKSRKLSKAKKERATHAKQELKIKAPQIKPIKETPAPKQEVFEFMRSGAGFQMPSINFLDDPDTKPITADDDNLVMQSKLLEKKLDDFGVNGKVVTVTPGPVITTFEYEPAPGVNTYRCADSR